MSPLALMVLMSLSAAHVHARKKLPAGPAYLSGLPIAESYRMVLELL